MSDEVATSSTEVSGKSGYADYKPLVINLGVWFNMKAEGRKSSLSLNMTRDALQFVFRDVDEAGQKQEVFKRLSKAECYMFVNMFKALLADRLAIAKQAFQNGTKPNYSVIPELDCQLNNLYFSKETHELNSSGNMTLSTVEVNGVNRMAISVHTNDGKNIRVIFFEDKGSQLVQLSKYTVVDPEDLQFYIFCLEIEKSLGKTVEYAGFDKLYQMLKRLLGNNNPSESGERKNFFGGFFKKEPTKVEVNDTSSDADSDLFGGIDETSF